MDITTINKILNILILIGLIILLIVLTKSNIGNCESCKFIIDDKTYNGLHFLKKYQEDCIDLPEYTLQSLEHQSITLG